jgi:hypothetical protein
MILLGGMLGFGGLRTYEKKNGISDTTAIAQTAAPQSELKQRPKLLPDWLR